MTEVTDNTVVDGRYRILGRIGSGGMADVYRAEDTHLGREVALKVLHRRFAQDAEFVERFRREASSAAGLQHPHVVGVFDRGQHEGTYYIAMECLAGRNLKELVAQEAPLTQERVIDLGLQILSAAGFAHRHGIIHRDLKPHNVIVDDAGSAKVTDFGIARAGASEMTETGSIMGTAQYLSPEQAQGHAVSAASDLYSTGVMLYELLAGRVPFEGDSAVSIALKHLSEPPAPLSQLRPDVSPALETVIMSALAKDPAHRWQSAEDFASALEAARDHLTAAANGGQNTAAFAPVPIPVPLEGEGPYEELPPEEEEERKRRWPRYLLWFMVAALVALLAYMAIAALTKPEMVNVPNVTARSLEDARARLEKAGFEVRQVGVTSLAPFDEVVDQDPDAGEEAEKGSVVTLEVSRGPGRVRVPSVEDLPQAKAVKELKRVGLKVNVDAKESDTVPEGIAIRTVPEASTPIERGTRVRLFVSSGPERVTVPGVVGLSRESAESRLAADDLEVAVEEETSEEPEGEVLAQSPSSGSQVEKGTRVTITVSSGKETVAVPNVVGQTREAAQRTLRAAGLSGSVRERQTSSEDDDGTVLDQQPGAGTEVEKGSAVTIIVGIFEDPAEEELPPPEEEEVTP